MIHLGFIARWSHALLALLRFNGFDIAVLTTTLSVVFLDVLGLDFLLTLRREAHIRPFAVCRTLRRRFSTLLATRNS
jgi:hypothetical protein